MNNFWLKFKKPILALAPMAGFTDSAFRQICKSFGAQVVYSEMASVTALVYNPTKTLEMLKFSQAERPYVVQLFGSRPEHFTKAAQLLTSRRQISKLPRLSRLHEQDEREIPNYKLPQGIDINFGCPVKKVAKQGAGAVLMNNLKLAREIVKSVIAATDLPVSIKCRSQVGQVDVLKFLDNLSDLDIKAVMIHGRSLAQGFSGPINTEIIKKAGNYFPGLILANGGVRNYEDGIEILEKTKADGLGIGRGALGRPWIFRSLKTQKNYENAEKKEYIFKIALKQAELAQKLKGEQGIVEMRKHLCFYVQGLPGAKKMREKLIKVESLEDIQKVFLKE